MKFCIAVEMPPDIKAPMMHPARGLAWTEADLTFLKGEIERAVPVTAIALQLGRTTEAVRAKAVKEGIIATNPRRERPRKKRFARLFGD